MSVPVDMYTKDFQLHLVTHLARDKSFFEEIFTYVRLEDFDLPACRLVYETLRNYYNRMHELPNFVTLESHVLRMVQNIDGQTETILKPEEYESLAYVLNFISTYGALNCDYYRKSLSEYLQFIRVSKEATSFINNMYQGSNTSQLITRMLEIKDGVDINQDIEIDDMLENPEPYMKRENIVRVRTSLSKLNGYIDGGLALKEHGMITACPGVGKTTSLINFMAGGIQDGSRSLFITIELPARRIKHRYHSILAGVSANWLKKPVSEWPEDIKRIYDYITSEQYRYSDYAGIVDFSDTQPSINQIERAIAMWQDKKAKRYGSTPGYNTRCEAVYVDWLDKISPEGVRTGKNDRDDTVLMRLNEHLGRIARKLNVAMWTATQGSREADGREVLKMRHTAFSYHKNDPIDVGLGLGVSHPDDDNNPADVQAPVMDDDHETAPECSRLLTFSLTKNRNNQADIHFEVYQGETLRLWHDRKEADRSKTLIANQQIEENIEYCITVGKKSKYVRQLQ